MTPLHFVITEIFDKTVMVSMLIPYELIYLNVLAGNPSYPELWKGPQDTKVNLIETSLSLRSSVELSKPMRNCIEGKTKSIYEQ